MSGPSEIRPVALADVDDVLALWQAGGLSHGADVDRAEIVAKLDHDPDLFLVLVHDGTAIASVMGTYDGHRGRVKRCVVRPDGQGNGLGRRLMQALEARFRERGITELRLEVWSDNVGAQAFWTDMGWEHLPEIRYYIRSLDHDEKATKPELSG